jgi:photosystem II stability/assembly factor-like uncharacterized protein
LTRSSFLLAALAVHTLAQAGPVIDALDRPAVMVRQPARAVLIGAARAAKRIAAVGERGIVALSDDDGASWHQAKVPVSVTLTAVRFVDPRIAYAVGHGGVVLSSADGGSTWVRRLDGRQAAALALQAAKASGDANAITEAERLVIDGPDKPFFDLHFFDARRGIVIGAYNLIFATTDGGESWQPWMDRLDNPMRLHLYALRAHGDTLVVAGEQGLVLRSDNGGKTFRRLETPYRGSFFTLELPSAKDIVVAGLLGNVWRSKDSGASWTQVSVNAPVAASITASALLASGELLLANQAGMLFKGAATGATAMVPIPQAPLPPLNAVLPLEDGALLALAPHGAITLRLPQALRDEAERR